MSDPGVETQVTQMTLGKGIGIYMALLVGWLVLGSLFGVVAGSLGNDAIGKNFFFLTYFICGFVMNRVVLRGLIEWHPVYNTLYNVSRSKLKYLIFWPIAYPILFFRLAVVKHL
jgi:uncharacterized membrane protein